MLTLIHQNTNQNIGRDDVEKHEFNTLLVYEGRMWHSPYFRQEGWDVDRLTFNAFLH